MALPASFLGLQPGYKCRPPLELYTLLVPVGEHPAGSTVSRQTLERHGFLLDADSPVAKPVAGQLLPRTVPIFIKITKPAEAAS